MSYLYLCVFSLSSDDSIYSIIILLILFVLGFCSDDPVGYQIIVPKRNLSCHECYRSVHGESCLTLTEKLKVQKCAVDELFCVVSNVVHG